ncbi:hypothetical protein ACRQ5Q_13645 [Bradyrhizobium sp. PMVTL-01]|uniref:hypothetical protein n=1 Tax=Bradyrhizobium sp. PMVTL-01 TaxID=3434999 RepID=UPI003F72C3F0
MTKKPAHKGKRKGGRPTRSVASKRALAEIDLSKVDPVSVLRQIAADASAPASARVQAARALIADDRRSSEAPPEADTSLDAVSRGALRILNGGKK